MYTVNASLYHRIRAIQNTPEFIVAPHKMRTLIVGAINRYGRTQERFWAHMAKPKNRTAWNDIKFSNYRLSGEELEKFKDTFDTDPLAILKDLHLLYGYGWKTSGGFNTSQAAFSLSITGTEGNKFNEGVCNTSWSDDPIECLCMAIWKGVYLFGQASMPVQENQNLYG